MRFKKPAISIFVIGMIIGLLAGCGNHNPLASKPNESKSDESKSTTDTSLTEEANLNTDSDTEPQLTVETVPIDTNPEMGENVPIGWVELGDLDSYPEQLAMMDKAIKRVYADVDPRPEVRVAWINAYYNLFDTPQGYFDGDQVLSRAEFLAGVYKAHNPVSELEANPKLGTDANAAFVNQMLPYSYLDLEQAPGAYSGIMTRAEAAYTLIHMYFKNELEARENSAIKLKNAKKLISEGSEGRTERLNDVLQNPENGLPKDLYETLCLAAEYHLVDETTRWNEGVTKTEALTMLLFAYKQAQLKECVQFEITSAASKKTALSLPQKDSARCTFVTFLS